MTVTQITYLFNLIQIAQFVSQMLDVLRKDLFVKPCGLWWMVYYERRFNFAKLWWINTGVRKQLTQANLSGNNLYFYITRTCSIKLTGQVDRGGNRLWIKKMHAFSFLFVSLQREVDRWAYFILVWLSEQIRYCYNYFREDFLFVFIFL